jgi:RNA recognition motif-containing protein
MGKKLFVGNLAYSVDSDQLQSIFSAVGNVTSAQVIMDRSTGRSKGFGFVEMETDQAANDGIQKLNGQDQGGRAMTVSEAKPQAPREGGGGRGGDRPRRGGGFGGGSGGGGGGRGRY